MKKFDKVFKHYDKFIELFNLNKAEEIKSILDLEGDEVALDIGGGTGKLAEYLSDYCQMVYVLDESKGMLSKVKKDTKILPILGDALDIEFSNNSLDVVIVSDVLHHIQNQRKLIEEIYRILRKNGKLVILDFEKKHFKIRALRIFEFILFGKLHFKTSKETIDLIKDKFTIVKIINKKHYFIIRGAKDA